MERINNNYKIALIGSEELSIGFKLAGIRNSYTVKTGAEAETLIRNILQNQEIGIIILSSKIINQIKDRKILNAIDTSILPLFVEVPDYGSNYAPDTLRRLILRAIGIDITKIGN
ncbi:MAG: V-type ATP synthase subunit F [Candidatus Micrarchaeaceae archaeon]